MVYVCGHCSMVAISSLSSSCGWMKVVVVMLSLGLYSLILQEPGAGDRAGLYCFSPAFCGAAVDDEECHCH